MKGHSFSYNIFTGNLREINGVLKIIENPDIGLKLMAENNQEAGIQVHKETNRLFHNFLASAKTLIEHTRIFMNKHYKGTSVYQAYTEKIKNEFSEDELPRFIQDLRNYMLHQGLPHNQMSITYTKEDSQLETTIRLDIKRMLEWSRWSSGSKNFLLNKGETIKFSSLVNPYGINIVNLYCWLEKKLYKYHSDDLEELKTLQELYSKLELQKS
jgi:hypothetical protein